MLTTGNETFVGIERITKFKDFISFERIAIFANFYILMNLKQHFNGPLKGCLVQIYTIWGKNPEICMF